MASRTVRVGLLFALLLAAPAASSRSAFEEEPSSFIALLADVVHTVDGWGIYDCVDAVTSDAATQYRLMGTPPHDAFVAKYARVFQEKAGLATQVVPFSNGGISPSSPIQGGHNIIGVLPGRDLSKWVVIGGHYDTRELVLGGGALDNTSGICTVLQLAQAFPKVFQRHAVQPEATVVFAWWDGEEWGLHGSRAFLDDPNATKRLLGLAETVPVDIVAAVSFDMVGLNYPAFNTWVRYGRPEEVFETAILNVRTAPVDPENFTLCPAYGCYRYESYREDQLENFTQYRALVEEATYRFLQFPPEYVHVYDDEYGRSDHVPFISRGIPGMRVQGSHDEEYPHYHQPTDTLEALTVLAGDETHLRAGFDKAADVGAVVFAYIAVKGHVGHLAGTERSQPQEAPMPPPAAATPGVEAAIALLVLLAWAWTKRE